MHRKHQARLALFLWIACTFLAAAHRAEGGDPALLNYARRLPTFALKDPLGDVHTSDALARDGLVLVVTTPLMRMEMEQRGWDEELRAAKKGSPGRIVFLQDMRPSLFKKYALRQMRHDYRAGEEPLLIIDEDGGVRTMLGVKPKTTVVLVYDRDRRLVYVEEGHPSSDAARRIWAALKR